MSSTIESRTAISPMPPATLRLRLQPDGPAYTLLDDRSRTPALLAAITRPAGPATVTAAPSIELSAWEWEGGQLRDRTPLAASAGPHATLLPAAAPRHP